ncbi:hypothetical protein ASC80_06360 [Afipia sp. Root123D2]|nr:hypothetical protein ASC80_06360 [Afipia sp. Root123D2]
MPGRQTGIGYLGISDQLEPKMNAEELANKFKAKIAAAVAERERQTGIANDNAEKRTADIEYCKDAL